MKLWLGHLCDQLVNSLDSYPTVRSPGMLYALEYARILVRLAIVMVNPSKQEYESADPAHRDIPLQYKGLVKVIESMVLGFLCPLDYGESLERLHKDSVVDKFSESCIFPKLEVQSHKVERFSVHTSLEVL